jgi:hypothetical protein
VPSYKNAIATGRYTLETIADKTRWVSAQQNAATTAESTAMVVAVWMRPCAALLPAHNILLACEH